MAAQPPEIMNRRRRCELRRMLDSSCEFRALLNAEIEAAADWAAAGG